MQESALYVEHIEQAQERLEHLLRAYQAEDRFAPVTVVAPTPYAALHLRRDIGRRGLINVRFMALARLAELLGAPSLAARGKRPLKPLIESAAVRRAAGKASGPLEPFRGHPSFHSSLRTTFRGLRYAAPDTLAALERRGEISRELVRLYALYRNVAESHYDREALAVAAADAVGARRATALTDLGPVIAYLPRDLTPGERRLLDALRAAWVCSTILGVTGDKGTDKVMLATAQPSGMRLPEPHEPSTLPPRGSSLLVASDTREEARSVVRAIAAAAHAGTPFHRMAVLYWERDAYASLIADQFAMAGVPIAGPSAVRLASTPVGRMVKGMVDLAVGDLSREDVMRWLTSCPVKPTSAGFSPARWDEISRDAGVVTGIEQWRDRLAHYAARQERAGKDQSEDLSEAKRSRIEQSMREARALRAFMLRLHDNLTPSDDGLVWAEFVNWVKNLCAQYLDIDALPSAERNNFDILQSALRELAVLDEVEEGVTLNGFRAALVEALSRPAAREGAFGEGVFVGPIRSAVGLRFDRVYLMGMVEGFAPPRASDDPLLPDREREQMGLPPRRGAAVERYEYLAAASAGRARTLTFARCNNVAQREQRPSRWFLEEASRLNGSPVYASMLSSPGVLSSLREQPWLEEVASAQDGINAASRSQPADLHDYDLHKLWQWRRFGKRIGEHHLAASKNVLARALEMLQARNGEALTIWDGDLSVSSSGRIGFSNREIFSPTALETWATCPYRYFLSNVLGIAGLEQPEEIVTISPLERGALVHTILKRFVRKAQEQRTIPPHDCPWNEESRRLLMDIADEEFREAERRGATGKQLLWEVAKTEIRSDLQTFLEEDAKLRNTYGVSPHSVEVDWESPKTDTIRFRGIIDRIDVSPRGDAALVLDYKTGGTGGYTNMRADPVRRGTRLQLPLYGLAARRLLGDGVAVHAAYWFVSSKENFKTRPSKPASLDKMLDAFADVVDTIVDGIGKGLFPANPGKSAANCRYCDFKNLCPAWRVWHWRRKRGDKRLAAYVAMADEEGSR